MAETLNQTCKKCQLPIHEGHAYELGDDRWHISCFKCFKCDKSLGCNSNFLVLGTGNLVCASCSYSCKGCGKKIDDLAILTGDSAYCSNCFKCRVCKSKIEDLRYARTSKGLFCMPCHEDLLAKKKKHGLKRKQLAQLSSSSRPSPVEESEPQSLSSTPEVYSHRNLSSTSTLNKQLPPHPSEGRDREPEREGIPQKEEKAHREKLDSHAEDTPVQRLASPTPRAGTPTLDPIPKSANLGSLDLPSSPDTARAPNTPSIQSVSSAEQPKLLSSAVLDSGGRRKHDSSEIEEVKDSDDELNTRTDRENTRYRRKTDDGAILDLIESFSAPNTPDTIYNDKDESDGLARVPSKASHSSAGSRPKRSVQDSNLHHKNLLLLSPNQFHDNGFHNANQIHNTNMHKDNFNTLSAEEVARSRSTASSPMAKANRQARVVETNDESANEISSEFVGSKEPQDQFSTPRKTYTSSNLTSPPPRMALPNVPSTPKPEKLDFSKIESSRSPLSEPSSEYPTGLGLEGVDLQKTPRTVKKATPLITNLEETIPTEAEVESQKENLSRGKSMRNKLNLKHKRSTSSGSGSFSGKLGLFKGKEDSSQKGHARHVSEGSVNGQAFTTPPLPFSSPFRSATYKDRHFRSTSDTTFITSMDHDHGGLDLDLRSVKTELFQLDGKRQGLIAENMKLSSELNSLLERLDLMEKKLSHGRSAQETIQLEVNRLVAERSKLMDENSSLREQNKMIKDENNALKEENSLFKEENLAIKEESNSIKEENLSIKAENVSLRESTSRARERPPPQAPSAHRTSIYDLNQDFYDNSATIDSVADEGSETQKATRLKFWRRPKVTIAGAPANAPPGPGNPKNNLLVPNNQPHQSSNGDDSFGARKALNNIISKSRSTTILDSFINGPQHGAGNGTNSNDSPSLNSTIQRRAYYENERVPLIITKCLEEVENRGMDMEGIYRLSGGNSAINAIETAFASIPPNPMQDQKSIAKIQEVLGGDINAVTSALKRYLRKLSDPLIPYAQYDEFIRIGRTKAEPNEFSADFINNVINNLPPANKHALYLIGKHLTKVNYYSSVNRMNFKNLSVVFAPTIAWDPTGEREMSDMGARNDATEMFLNNFNRVFADYGE